MGRPTRYKAEFAEQAEKLCKLGATDAEMADFFGVTEATINNWKKSHSEFFESIKRGKLLADANVADSLYKRATGYTHKEVKIATHEGQITDEKEYDKHYPPDTTACLAWLNNRQRERWQRNPDPAGGGADLPPTKVVFEVHDARTREDG